MGNIDKNKYWWDLADYDMETAKAMLETKRWLYVGFMCHQAVEKALKAYWCLKQPENDPPYKHNLFRLVQGAGLEHKMSEAQLDFIDGLTPLNIEARYPSFKDKLLKSMTSEYCGRLRCDTEELLSWIKSKQ